MRTLRLHQYFPCGLSTFQQLISFPSIRQRKHCEVAKLNFALLNPVKHFGTSPLQIFVCGNMMEQGGSAYGEGSFCEGADLHRLRSSRYHAIGCHDSLDSQAIET